MKINFTKNNSIKIENMNKLINISSNEYYRGVRLTNEIKTGKYYYEVTLKNIKGYMIFGVCTEKQDLDCIIRYSDFTELIAIDNIGEVIQKGSFNAFESYRLKNNDTIGVCIDYTNREITYTIYGKTYSFGKKDEVWKPDDIMYPCFITTRIDEVFEINFGNSEFKYTHPLDCKFFIEGSYLLKNNDKLFTLDDNTLDIKSYTYQSISEMNKENSFKNINKLIEKVNVVSIKPNLNSTLKDGYKEYLINLNSNIKSLTNNDLSLTENMKTVSILPNFGKSYEKDGFKISATSEYGSGYELYNAFDDINGWDGGQYYSSKYLTTEILEGTIVTIELNKPEVLFKLSMDLYYYPQDYSILGSVNGKDYEEIKTGKAENISNNISLECTKAYKFIQLKFPYKTNYVYLNNVKLFKKDEDKIIRYNLKKGNEYYDFKEKTFKEMDNDELLNNSLINSQKIYDFMIENKLDDISMVIITKDDLVNKRYNFLLNKSFIPIEQFEGDLEVIFITPKNLS